ncbi:hypothetical protein TNCV_3078501 [Trichonephila clavipes]|nr:hypothetical protein TNCV_3078501 [Trichonephila clavipes]
MIEIDESQRDFTRFFWDENPGIDLENKRLDIFRMTRVLFGVKSSPFLLAATIKHHLNPLTGYLPPEKLFRKRLTLILRFPSKMQQTSFLSPF